MQRLLKIAQARNLDRIAVAYAVAGWILVQGAAIIFPAFDAPAWVLRAFIIAVVAGFPLALTVAWFATPHSDAIDETTGGISHREIVLLALLGAVLLLSVGELVFVVRRTPPAPVVASAEPARASIAVLPFLNLSGDPGREIVSDGISEELLNDLSTIPALRVAARTSSFAFKDKNEDIRRIASVLGVRTVLEGSIREDGTHIRIAAQLINAADGYGLWSASYDREMTGILTLEDEIARAITAALTNRLLGVTPLAGRPAVIDPTAYRKYLEGQHAFAPRTADGVKKAVALFEDVTAMQPDFADGFAALGRALINHAEYHPERKDLMPRAEAALARALALDPDNINALSAHLDLAFHRLDWPTADADAKRLKAINPGNYAVLHEMFRYYQLLGFPDRALAAVRSATALDPLSFVDRYNVVAALIHNGQYADAIEAAPAALRLEPNQSEVLAMLCTADTHNDRLPDAHAIMLQLLQGRDETSRTTCEFDIDVAERRIAEARRIEETLASEFPRGDFGAADIGEFYARTGDFDKAAGWLARSYDAREFGLFTFPYTHSIPRAFFQTAAWKSLKQRPLFTDWQSAHDNLAREFATVH